MYRQYSLLNYSLNQLDDIARLDIHPLENTYNVSNKLKQLNKYNKGLKKINNAPLDPYFKKDSLLLYSIKSSSKTDLIKYFIDLTFNKEYSDFVTKEDFNLILCFIVHKCNREILDFFIDKIKGWYKYYEINFEKNIDVPQKYFITDKELKQQNVSYYYNDSNKKINLLICALLNKNYCTEIIEYFIDHFKLNFWGTLDNIWNNRLSFYDLHPLVSNYQSFNNLIQKTSFPETFNNFYIIGFMEYYESYYYCVDCIDTIKNLVEKICRPKAIKKYVEILCKNYNFDRIEDFFEKLINPTQEQLNLYNLEVFDKFYFSDLFLTIVKRFDERKNKKIKLINLIIKKMIIILKSKNMSVMSWLERTLKTHINDLAASPYSLKILKILKKHFIDLDDLDYANYTPLMDAAKYGDFETFKFLLNNTQDSKLSCKTMDTGEEFMSLAVLNKDIRILEYISKKQNLKIKTALKDFNEYFSESSIEKISTNLNKYTYNNKNKKYLLKRIKLFDTIFPLKKYVYTLFSQIECINIELANKIVNYFENKETIYCNDIVGYNIRSHSLVSIILLDKIHYLKLFSNLIFFKRVVDIVERLPEYIRINQMIQLLNTCLYLCQYKGSKHFDYLTTRKKFNFNFNISKKLEIFNLFLATYSEAYFKPEKSSNLTQKFNLNFDNIDNQFADTIDFFKEKNMSLKDHRFINIIRELYVDHIKSKNLSLIYNQETNYKIVVDKHYIITLKLLFNKGLNILSDEFQEKKYPFKYNTTTLFSIYDFLRDNDDIVKISNAYKMIKNYIIRRKKLDLSKYKLDLNEVNHEIKYYPDLDCENKLYKNLGYHFKQNFRSMFCEHDTEGIKYKNPVHANPENIYQFKNCNNVITQKIDGVTKYSLKDIDFYPCIYLNLNILPDKFSTEDIVSEYVEGENMYYIIDTKTNNIDTFKFNKYLRHIHPFVNVNINPMKKFNRNDLIKIMKQEQVDKDQYIKSNTSSKALWWPKPFWITNKNIQFIDDLEKIKDLEFPIYPTDGWVVTNLKYKNSIKVKPDKHITVDLKYNDGRWYTKDSKVIEHVDLNINNLNLKNKSLYRCYFNTETKNWCPREIRTDKYNANTTEIESELYNYHLNKWSYRDLKALIQETPYYHVNNYGKKTFDFKKMFQIIKDQWLSKLENKNICDLGCGYKFKKILKNIDFETYFGIDIDFDAYMKNKDIDDDKIKFGLIDFKKPWNKKNENTIVQYFNKIPSIQHSFDTFISINTIQYAAETKDSWNNFVEQVTMFSSKGTKLFINFLDGDLLLDVFEQNNNLIKLNTLSYVKKINKDNDCVDYWIKYYYDWCHTHPNVEPVLKLKNIISSFEEKGWKVNLCERKELLENNDNLQANQYFNCFSKIILEK